MMLVQRGLACTVALLASLACACPALAQVAAPGSHVRIQPLNGGPLQEGTLVTMMNDTVTLHPGISDALLRIPLDSVRTVFSSDGARRHPVRSGMIGAGVGLGGLVLALAATSKVNGEGDGPGAGVALVYWSVPAVLLGFATGYIIGESHPSESWERVYERPRTASLLVGPDRHGGFAFGVSIPFDAGSER